MRKVDRVGSPDVLFGQDRPQVAGATKKTEFDKVVVHRQKQLELAAEGKKTSSFKFALYSHKQVKQRLEEMFHGKCAYCESFYGNTQPVDVEHYRPKNAVGDTDHEGYWWLAMEWHNLLPSCIDCNRKRNQRAPDPSLTNLVDLFDTDRNRTVSIKSGKGTTFPLADETKRAEFIPHGEAPGGRNTVDNEARLLLDPTRDDPEDHLVFSTRDVSVVGHKTPMGAMSIQVYGLNRLNLVQERTKLLRNLDFLLDTYLGLTRAIEEINDKLIVPKRAELVDTNGGARAKLQAELVECESINAKLSNLKDNIVQAIRDKAQDPKQSYVALVNAWLNDRL